MDPYADEQLDWGAAELALIEHEQEIADFRDEQVAAAEVRGWDGK